jgi:hypothetical protein
LNGEGWHRRRARCWCLFFSSSCPNSSLLPRSHHDATDPTYHRFTSPPPSLPVVAFSDLRGPPPRWRHLSLLRYLSRERETDQIVLLGWRGPRDGLRWFVRLLLAAPRARAPPSTTIAHASQPADHSQGTRRIRSSPAPRAPRRAWGFLHDVGVLYQLQQKVGANAYRSGVTSDSVKIHVFSLHLRSVRRAWMVARRGRCNEVRGPATERSLTSGRGEELDRW